MATVTKTAEIMGVTEIGEMLGVSPRTVSQWRIRGIFPEPDVVLAVADLWKRETVTAWAEATGRTVAV